VLQVKETTVKQKLGWAALVVCGLVLAPNVTAKPPLSHASTLVAKQQKLFDAKALAYLLEGAQKSHSSALVIYKGDQLVGEWYFGQSARPIELMSCTKSVVALAIGRLIDTGKIKSVDQPIADFYPEWKQGSKRKITLRHILNHTSGLQNVSNTSVEIYPSKNFVKLALAAEVSDPPGTKFEYNNKAVNLLAGVIQKASGKRMDHYVRDEIFKPLGIKQFAWTLDASGNPHAMSGLALGARDFAKLGLLLLHQGKWQGKRIVSERWLNTMLAQGQPYDPSSALLWWRIAKDSKYVIEAQKFTAMQAAGIDQGFIEKLLPLKDQVFDNRDAYDAALINILGKDYIEVGLKVFKDKEKLLPLARRIPLTNLGYEAQGYLGQYLLVVPEQQLVVVRQVEGSTTYNEDTDGFYDFPLRVRKLALAEQP